MTLTPSLSEVDRNFYRVFLRGPCIASEGVSDVIITALFWLAVKDFRRGFAHYFRVLPGPMGSSTHPVEALQLCDVVTVTDGPLHCPDSINSERRNMLRGGDCWFPLGHLAKFGQEVEFEVRHARKYEDASQVVNKYFNMLFLSVLYNGTH